jgi:predicted Zn finger-like uncharacterized protein
VVVICPKCKTKLKVDDAKLSPQGSRFKCPRCTTVLLVKKPSKPIKRELDPKTILVAHSNPAIVEKIGSLLSPLGYNVVHSADGIDAMVKALRDYPFLAVVEVVLPKIYGFELCKRLKSRSETKDMKVILITNVYDKTKYRREPTSLHGADEYIEDHNISDELVEKIQRLIRGPEEKPKESPEPSLEMPGPKQVVITKKPEPEKVEFPAGEKVPAAEEKPPDEQVAKAGRLARTIINDIYLYNSSKVDESIRNNNFFSVFEAEVSEGRKLYENRIPAEVRNKGDFFNEAIENFITKKKGQLD